MRPVGPLVFALVALGVLYAGLMLALPPGAFFSGDEGIKWLQIDSLWRHRFTTLAIDPPGGALDPDARFIPAFLVRAGGSVRSIFPATLPAIASLPYALAGSRGIYIVPALAALLCAVAAARLGGFLMPAGWAAASGAAAVAATPLVFYGATIWEHTLAAALCTAAMIPLSKGGPARPWGRPLRLGLAAGALIGLAAASRTECALMIPATIAAGTIAWGARGFAPRAIGTAAGAALVLLPQALYHRATFGSWLPPHLRANLPGGALARPARSPWAVAGELIGPAGGEALFAIALAACAALGLAAWLHRRRHGTGSYPRALVWAGAALAVALAAGPLRTLLLEFSSSAIATRERGYHALLHTMPLIALAPVAMLLPPAPRRAPAGFLGWTAGLFVALAATLSPVPGGLQWGPRLLLAACPLIVVAIMAAVARCRQGPSGRPAVIALTLALGLSLVMQGVGLRFLVAVRSYNAGVIERVRRTVPAGDAILSDFFAVPQLLATLTPSTPVLYVRPGADLETLLARLAAADVTPYWILRDRPASGAGVVDLGAGLSLVRYEQEAGVRGFLRPPRGD